MEHTHIAIHYITRYVGVVEWWGLHMQHTYIQIHDSVNTTLRSGMVTTTLTFNVAAVRQPFHGLVCLSRFWGTWIKDAGHQVLCVEVTGRILCIDDHHP